MARPLLIVPTLSGARDLAQPRRDALGLPQVTYHGGKLLTSVQVTPLFWGGIWRSDAALHQLGEEMIAFFDYIVTSPYMNALSEYSVDGQAIMYGSSRQALLVSGQSMSAVDDSTLASTLDQWVQNGFLSNPTQQELFFVLLPPGMTSTLRGQASCAVFCGYHSFTPGGLYYAVLPYPDCQGCQRGSIRDSLTSVASHELAEAVTDPTESGWYDDSYGEEIGDMCLDVRKVLGGYTVQGFWSNMQQGCIVPDLTSAMATSASSASAVVRVEIKVRGL